MASFFTELKRRNVFKVAAAYAIVSWLLIQIIVSVKALAINPKVASKRRLRMAVRTIESLFEANEFTLTWLQQRTVRLILFYKLQ